MSLKDLVRSLVLSGSADAAAGWIGGPATPPRVAFGGRAEEVGPGARFDLASLTKPCMATLAARLDARGELPLDRKLGEIWPQAAEEVRRTTLRGLLVHEAGYRPWTALSLLAPGGRDEAARLLIGTECLGAESGTYSDLDFVLWGLTAERVSGTGLQELWRRAVGDLHHEIDFLPGGTDQVLESPLDGRRETELAAAEGLALDPGSPPERGTVQDGNARHLGGISAHAGLFGTLGGVARLSIEWLRPGGLLPVEAVSSALRGGGRWALGWERRADGSFDHRGFTGGYWQLDPASGVARVLLAHRSGVHVDLEPWREQLRAIPR